MMNYKNIGALTCGVMALSLFNLLAEEYTVEKGELKNVIKVNAVAIPVEALPVKISPQVWKNYKIESFVEHGTVVKKGEVLISVDTEDLDEKIEESTEALVREKLMLEKAQLKFTDFQLVTDESIKAAKLKYDRFNEDHKRYQEVVKPVQISDIEYSVTRATQILAYSQEELEQLMKMYEEDGLTEETEEIILQRVKNALVNSQRGLDNAKRVEKNEKEVLIVRSDADWKIRASKQKRMWELSQKELPLELKVKGLEITKMERDLAKSQKALTKLKADRELMSIVSPVDGVVYYGEFKDGKWDNEAAKKAIRVGGNIPAEVILMSVVPEEAELTFSAFFSEKQKAQLGDSKSGNLRLEIQNWDNIPVTIESVSDMPLLNHKWIVTFTPQKEMEEKVIIGSKAEVSVVTVNADDVLSIPKKSVKLHTDGTFSVKLKMADGEPKETTIQIGRETSDKLEVLNGLENGQVIIVPKAKAQAKAK